MNGAAVIADVVPPSQPSNILASSPLLSYNISLNFSSIFAMLPKSRLLARLRRSSLFDASNPLTVFAAEGWVSEVPGTFPSIQNSEAAARGPGIEQLPAFPGPWAFFTSWYMIGLLVMAILLHRMHNVIIPSRLPARRSRHAYRFGPSFASPWRHSFSWQHIFGSFLPLNLARTSTRLVLHLPSVYFLAKMLLLWSLLALQTSEIFPEFSDDQKVAWYGVLGWVDHLGKWCGQKDMSEICWETFCAVCAAFLVEGFIKALDGMGTGFPINNVNPNTSPFNLSLNDEAETYVLQVGYAFLLHVYSSPVTHTFKPENGASRPDKHAIITIGIPLLQLTIFHILSISKRLSTHRLFPTALTSLLSLAHFHGTLFSHQLFKPPIPSPSATVSDPPPATPQMSPYLGRSTVNYPLLNYIPNIFESLLIVVILTTVFLNALVQLLVRGRIDRVLSGLGVGQGSMLHDDDGAEPGFFQSLPLEEDFGVLLLRVGIASMEATGLRGWSNEVAPINLPVRIRRGIESGREASDRADAQSTYGMVRMGREDVGEVHYGSSPRASRSVSTTGGASTSTIFRKKDLTRRRKKAKAIPMQHRGFNNDVRTVDLGNSESANQNRRGFLRWLKEVWMFLTAFWSVLRGLVTFLIERAKGRVRMRESAAKSAPGSRGAAGESNKEKESDEEDISDEEARRRKEREVYQRFLRGEDISDDDDDEEDEGADLLSSDDEESDGGEGDNADEREAEAVGLFTDLIRNSRDRTASTSTALATSSDTGGSGEMVLAHLMHGGNGASPSPLTRRRWNALVRNDRSAFAASRGSPDVFGDDSDDDNGLWEVTPPPRAVPGGANDEQREARLHNACVICTSEARDIICWPCRCVYIVLPS
ncbi:hypothetical protein CVT25_012446 [Psilocybe cyanescens]|uniref:Uncharacterized protein n=1 Tax=Psilocybe cyanescens TaxID=93625 RepID=A0A409XC56_PSICY|nr:hypothetical protein CVT25_012446 [Psilocybe cyanescens]